jgi:peptidoglycan/LPS O-acetylase OafA/YrhL
MRGLAVVAVVLFHARLPWARGGFLGVSAFFTLSGFLITSLLLAEYHQSGTVALGGFWGRRARRLFPAALVTIVAVALLTPVLGTDAQQRNLFGDVAGALGYVANWRFVLSGQSYGALFDAPSPLVHFWSLAIEEQFYLLFPLIAALVLVSASRRTRSDSTTPNLPVEHLAAVLAALFAASFAVTLLAGYSTDRSYYGTDTRASELLAGALLAVLLTSRGWSPLGGPTSTGMHRTSADRERVLGWFGVAALAGCVALWSTTAQNADWLYRGGFVAHALLWCVVLAAALLPGGPVVAALSIAPLRFLGRISYGVYLYHWPIFLWLDEGRTGLSGVTLFGYRVAATLAVAWMSYRYLERPILDGRPLAVAGRWRPSLGALAVCGSVLALGVSCVATLRAPAARNDFGAAQRRLAALGATAGAPVPLGAPRIAVFGDSTALSTGLGLGEVLSASGRAEAVGGKTELGCGIGRGGQRRTANGIETVPDRCNAWERDWLAAITRLDPTVAVVQVGPWDVLDRRLDGDGQWRRIGDPVYDTYLLDEMTRAVDVLSSRGAVVVWLTSPAVGEGAVASGQPQWQQAAEPERMARFNELVRQLPSLRPGHVQVIDLAGWLAESGEDARLRPDGVHLGEVESREVARRFLMDAILAVVEAPHG